MKKTVKLLALVMVIACFGMTFAGCGKTTTTGDAKKASDSSSTQKELVVATNAEFPPFEFVSQKGVVDKYDGIDIAIMKEVAKKLNRKLVISDMKFDSVIGAVVSGKADIAVAGLSVTPDRKENLDFSVNYYTALQTILVQKDNTAVKDVDSLKGKTVGVATSYTGDIDLSEVEKSKNITIKRYSKGIDAVQDLKNGKLDAVVIDSPTAKSFIKQNTDLKGVADNKFFAKEEYAMGVKKGNSELLKQVDDVLKEMKSSGRIDAIAKEVGERMAAAE